MTEQPVDRHLEELAAAYVAAVDGGSRDYWGEGGESFRFTANGHTVEVLFETDEQLGWRITADGIVVKEEDEEDEARPSAFEEAWLILSRLVRPNCEAEVSRDVIQKAHRASLII